MSQELVEFPPVCTDESDAENVIGDLVNYVEAVKVPTFIYIGNIVVFIKPNEDRQSVCERFKMQARKNRDWTERRNGGDRRLFYRDDGRERRSA